MRTRDLHDAARLTRAHDYDVAILGGGLAGLSLAVRLAEPRFRHLRVVVVEPRPAYKRDRTWCYWRLERHPFEAAVTHRWARWAVARPGVRIECSAPSTPYECIPADRLYMLALDRIAAAPNVELRLGVGAAPSADEEGVDLGLPGGERARLAFDSRPARDLGQYGLAQLFLGQEVEIDRPSFDPGCATLMDLDPAHAGVHFTYVLPMSTTRALVEDTWFAPPGFTPPDHQAALRAWLRARGDGECRVLYEERGRLPMDPVFAPARAAPRLIPLGAAAGAHRPSTGYAFGAIQAECDRIAEGLAAGQLLPLAPRRRPAAVRGMDRALLALLARRPEVAPRLFSGLFAYCSTARLVRFLADRPRPADLAATAFAVARALAERA